MNAQSAIVATCSKPRARWSAPFSKAASARSVHPVSQRRDCQGRLVAALLAMAPEGWLLAHASLRPWSSATFIGAQHRISLQLTGADAMAQARQLGERLSASDFGLGSHIVADLAVDEVRAEDDQSACLILAILTIEDW